MTQWQYCEFFWRPQGVTITEYSADGQHQVQNFEPHESPTVFARLGVEGWELTCTVASPVPGTHEYWYYFKRPVAT